MNDERPRFLVASYSFHVLENQAAGTVVGVVSARDDDGAPYNQMSLSLLPAGSLSDAFSIDPLNGRLLTTRPLDRERQVSGHFVLCVVIYFSASVSNNIKMRLIVLADIKCGDVASFVAFGRCALVC